MKTMMFASLLLILSLAPGQAQTQFKLTFQGVSFQTNTAGVLTSKSITEKTWIRDFARTANVSPTSVTVVYHVKGSSLGDTIDIVNIQTGEVLQNLFGLFFGEDFGRMALTSRNSRTVKRLDYIYTSQNSHSLGCALITANFSVGSTGKTNRSFFTGQMDYLVTPEGSNGLKVCKGSFFTGKVIGPPAN